MATARGAPINTFGHCRLIYGRAIDEPRAAIKIMASKRARGTASVACVETRELPRRVTFMWQRNYFYDIFAVSDAGFVQAQVLPFAKQIKSKL